MQNRVTVESTVPILFGARVGDGGAGNPAERERRQQQELKATAILCDDCCDEGEPKRKENECGTIWPRWRQPRLSVDSLRYNVTASTLRCPCSYSLVAQGF